MKSYAYLIAVAAIAASLILPTAAGTAEAATAAPRPAARLVLASDAITAGAAARIRYTTAGLPAGSAVRLQERATGPGHAWITAARLNRAGTITAPGAPAGHYAFRVLVTDDGHRVVASSPAYLTVRKPAAGGGSILGSIWNWVKHESSAIIDEAVTTLILSFFHL